VLSNPQLITLQELAIYDSTGKLIKTIDLKAMGSVKVLDISELSSATYLFVIAGNDGQVTKQILVK
jgi:hypothetical protein